MKFHRGIAIGMLSLFLLACASTTKNFSANQELSSNQGIVVTKLHSNWQGYGNPLLADLELVFTDLNGTGQDHKFVLSQAGDLKVVALPAGDYQWFRMLFGNYYRDLDGGFTVKAGEITYIGDIRTQLDLGTFSAASENRVTDDSGRIRNEIQQQYPGLLNRHPFSTQITTLQ